MTAGLSRSLGILTTALLLVVLTACTFGPPKSSSVPHTYLLSLEREADELSTEIIPAADAPTLLVNVPKAQAGFDTPRMVYLQRPHEVQYFATSQWADTPARMLAPLLVQVLERTGGWGAVIQMPSSVRGDYRVDIDNLSLQQEFVSRPSLVRLAFRAQLVDLRRQCVLGVRGFVALEEASSEDAYGGVLAANRAVATLLPQLAAWLNASINQDLQDAC